MSPTDLAIHDIARALSDLQVKDTAQRRAIFVKTLQGLARFVRQELERDRDQAHQDSVALIRDIQAASRIK